MLTNHRLKSVHNLQYLQYKRPPLIALPLLQPPLVLPDGTLAQLEPGQLPPVSIRLLHRAGESQLPLLLQSLPLQAVGLVLHKHQVDGAWMQVNHPQAAPVVGPALLLPKLNLVVGAHLRHHQHRHGINQLQLLLRLALPQLQNLPKVACSR